MEKPNEANAVKKPLARRITLQLLALMLVMTAIITPLTYWALESTYMRLYNEKAQDLLQELARSVDGDRLAAYVETGVKDEYYGELEKMFNIAKGSFRGIEYIYMYYPMDDHLVYIVEGMKEGDNPDYISALGDVFEYQDMALNYMLPDARAGRASSGIHEGPDQGFGKCIYTWAPVFDSAGNVAAMVEADCALSELNSVVRSFALPILAALIACILVIAALVVFALRQTITKPLGQLTSFVKSYEHGTINEDLSQFKHEDEMRYMADSFQEMTFRIDKYIHDLTAVTAEKERIGAELNVATQIQADMLPRIFPAFPGREEFDLYATMDPAKEVGGDFYDFFLVDDDHLAMVMADVSGKGVPAALFMVIAKTLIKNRTQQGGTPKEILSDVNNQLCEGNDAGLFVTVWLGILTISTGHVISASAGHEYPAIYRPQEGFTLLKDKHGPPLATMEGLRFRETEFDLGHGDALYLYTDGVTEATNAAPELFGEQRMLDALNHYGTETPQNILAGVRREIDEFVADAPQFDDITMLGLRLF
ncbi:MAG: SpoIIE family protein phosphatase [Oscillospiraceae bacterium]|nr:SpoIIE family protein phosphatase [Oscillospiraceae bacterium]